MSDQTSKVTTIGAITRIWGDWKSIANFWFFIAGLVLIVDGGIFLLGLVIRPLLPGARVTTTEKGAYIIEIGGKRSVQWLYSASSKPSPETFDESLGERIWSDSGIKVSAGDWVKLRVSGAVNLAIHHLVKSSETDTPPFFHWSGPDGVSAKQAASLRRSDNWRLPRRIAPGQTPGKLLMQVVPDDRKPQVQPDAEFLYAVGSGKDGPFHIRQSGTLHFALNEVPLDETMHNYYVITSSVDADYESEHPVSDQEHAWKKIVEQKYWDIWFDDNVGSFLITAEIE